ncbi:hypothetical protein JHK82_035228 [Glycine max]|uniref:Putative mitochondrial protein n=1 Tax=Glycine soja TaxID=3848 RepID=A0A0B2S3R3_GLYSO|nr:hypothetical protein JHK87_035166 [Glycine soja]KAG4969530.1 hypothetical protein JHK85_035951 [Glycine max]KAG4975885.1 hypothetical protein JHK86_035359 [Glycine max]KAG5111959.1 hypothetical protein JHK82_035228 [Glycine max]KAG5129244.1 hypothetical protein JHK84_035641 [Glycine max]
MKKFNKSLLAKQMWRLITNEESLATQVLRARYFPWGSPLDAQKAHRPSYTWSNIFSSKDLIDNGVVWRIDEAFSIKTSYFQATHPSGPHIPSSSLISGDYWKKFWKIKLVPNSLA